MLTWLWYSAALAARPAQMVGPTEQAAYARLLQERAAEAFETYGGGSCSSLTVSDEQTQAVAVKDHPEIPAFRERLRVTGCGRSARVNVFAARLGGSPSWSAVASVPGDSLADVRVQRRVWQELGGQVAPSNGCPASQLNDIYVTARPGHVSFATILPPKAGAVVGELGVSLPAVLEDRRDSLALTRAWAEVWPLTLCGRDRTTTVVVIPHYDGGDPDILLMPVWRQVERRGPGARPSAAPST